VKDKVPSPCSSSRAAQLNRWAPVVRVLSLLLRMAGYIAIWVAIVLAFALLTALLPSLWRRVQPSSYEHADIGLISIFAGFIGLFVGLWPAIVGVEWLVQRNDRRARERALRSRESRA
jgi:hypothetical protein